MFPSPGDQIYRNEAGEVLGWDKPSEPDYCDIHGITFMSAECPGCRYDEDYLDDDPNERDSPEYMEEEIARHFSLSSPVTGSRAWRYRE